MACELSTQLLAHDGFEVSHVAAAYLAWYLDRGFDTGPTAADAFHRMMAVAGRGADPDKLTPEALEAISHAVDKAAVSVGGTWGGCVVWVRGSGGCGGDTRGLI
jgi:hypothetical protein